MRTLFFCLKKEFLLVFRNKVLLGLLLFMPIVQLLFLPFAADMDVRNLKITIVDNDKSMFSQQLIQKIDASKLFHISTIVNSYQEGLTDVEAGNSDIIIQFPRHFEKDLLRTGKQQVYITANAINGVKAGLGSNYLIAILQDFNKSIQLKWAGQQMQIQAPQIRYSYWFNPYTNFRFYMVPGILALLLTTMTGFVAALNIVGEKESGTMEQINVTPLRRGQFILGKLVPFWVIGMIMYLVGVLIMRFVYGIHIEGSFFYLTVFAAIYIVAILGLGLFISTFAHTQQQSMFIAFFFVMILILMSGLFTNVESMPKWAYYISQGVPMTHFNTAFRAIILKGSSIADLVRELLLIIAFGVVMTMAAISNYKKTV